jgi:hypothetical protein
MSRPITRRAAMAVSLGWLLAGEIAKPAPKREPTPVRPAQRIRLPGQAAPIRDIDENTW